VSFLQPLILAALPLIALPILIHLINQYRHRTVPWAAMMFLIRARRMNKGMARLRYVLIMLMRMAAIAALIFALSRPLARGWWSGIGMTKPDATLVLLDRSASMEAQDLQTGESKRSTALKKLSGLLGKRNYGSDLVLIDSASGAARSIESPEALPDLPFTSATATSTDIPGMLEQGLAYLEANDTGRADVWICSDLQENDWDPSSGRWAVIREQLAEMKGVRLFLLSYPNRPLNNLSVRVANVKRRQQGNQTELTLDVLVKAEGWTTQPSHVAPRVPVEFEVDNVRSVVELELDAQGASLLGHRISVEGGLLSGWGSVTLPGDSNPQDNRFYFVFAEPPVRRAIIVTDDSRSGEAFRLALAIPPEPGLRHQAEVLPLARVAEIDWESTGLLIWQAPLPRDLVAEQIGRTVDSGRVVLFFPPDQKTGGQLFSSRWGIWQSPGQEPARLAWWRGDGDLLAHVGSGDPLPLNELRIYRRRGLESAGTALARFEDHEPFLARVPTDRGGVYFCTTLPTAQHSSLERDAVAFYAMLQRALSDGSRALAAVSQRDAGSEALADRIRWELVAPQEAVFAVSQRGLLAGVYREGETWAAVNRSQAEDRANVATGAMVDGLFDGLSFQRIEDAVGDTSPLAREIWRTFLIAMILALVLEAVLCLPKGEAKPRRFGEFAPISGGTRQGSA
jgi:hypothetical protein